MDNNANAIADHFNELVNFKCLVIALLGGNYALTAVANGWAVRFEYNPDLTRRENSIAINARFEGAQRHALHRTVGLFFREMDRDLIRSARFADGEKTLSLAR